MRVAVVGAGLAGLVAARELSTTHEVVVIERARSVGGRLATRRLGSAVIDHGPQFFTVRGAAFGRQVDEWESRGLARVWCHGFTDPPDGHPRYTAVTGMNSLAKDLAHGLDVLTNSLAFTVRPAPARAAARWEVVIDDGTVVAADCVVLTCPVPQSWALLAGSGVDIPDELARTDYRRTVTLLAVLDRPSPSRRGVQFDPDNPESPFAFFADQHAKGVSPVPAVAIHGSNPWSLDQWEASTDQLAAGLLERAGDWLGGARPTTTQIKRWRFATPASTWSQRCWVEPDSGVVVAGEAFAGPRIEGAFDSGHAAAVAINSLE